MKTASEQKMVTFIQYDIPPLRVGKYTLKATQTVKDQDPGSFAITNTYIVQGPRFQFPQEYINSVFPPDNSNGEFDNVLPHVVFNKCTFPWQRALKFHQQSSHLQYKCADEYISSPWLAVLLFNDGQAPVLSKVTAKDLVAKGTAITVTDSDITGVGTLDPATLSYSTPTLNPMGYGETPDDECTVIDILLPDFNQAAPCAEDMQYLGHIREVDITDGVNSDQDDQQFAVVPGNRIPKINQTMHAYLVSLENFADYLPDKNGKQSSAIPGNKDIEKIRLLCYRHWTYTANNLDQKLADILSNLNKQNGVHGLTTLQLPLSGPDPAQQEIDQAMKAQAEGDINPDQAAVLVKNALNMGYILCDHHLRHGGNTVSLYRGPLVPYPVDNTVKLPIAGPDAANQYNPQTGLFDVSYGAAWQIGQLLALQNSGFANTLYEWKRSQSRQAVLQDEQAFIDGLFETTGLFKPVRSRRKKAYDALTSDLPDAIGQWLGRLALLEGVPFNYLVPDERLLPPESLRFFFLDYNWIDALIDGAFSIGRSTTSEDKTDAARIYKHHAYKAMMTHRKNHSPVALADQPGKTMISGFLLRSQAVAGWPNLRIKGFDDTSAGNELRKLHLVHLSDSVLFGLFQGVLEMLIIEEPPEQLHLGVESDSTGFTAELREVAGANPGQIYQPISTAPLTMRDDKQTLQTAAGAASIENTLKNQHSQTFPNGFTSAEYALEMTKGVVMVEYKKTSKQELL